MREHHITVPRTARYFTLGEADEALRQVWFVCHGYGQLAARFLRHFEVLNDGRRLIVAPEALSRFYLDGVGGRNHHERRVGATWMTREDRLAEINDYVNYLDALYTHVLGRADRGTVQVHAMGFSQGVATVCRWIAAGSATVDHLILWAGWVPPDLDLEASRKVLQHVRLSLVLGTRDDYGTPEQVAEQEARLRKHGIPYRLITFDGGHHLDAEVLKQMAE
jgi:predicted esterase